MISDKGIELFSEDKVEIEKIWEKLEKEKPKIVPIRKLPGKLTKEIIQGESYNSETLPGKDGLDCSFELSEQSSHNPFETEDDIEESFEYDDAFEEGDDHEVENIIFNPHDSREFSLSKYEVNVKKFPIYVPPPPEDLKNNNRYFQHISTPSDDLDDIEEEDIDSLDSDNSEPQLKEATNIVGNKQYFQQSEVIKDNEDAGSGHVICDCEDCINQTDVVDCQCENCLDQREITNDRNAREITCNCEDCLNRCEEEEYVCQCENCVYENEKVVPVIGENNNPESGHCKCADCVQNSKLLLVKNEQCQCEKCVQSTDNLAEVRGHRSSPQGASQEYQSCDHDEHFDHKSNHSHSDQSFESETDKSFRSSRSKGSNSECVSEKSGHSHHGHEYINSSSREYLHHKLSANQAKLIHGGRCTRDRESVILAADDQLEADGGICYYEACVGTASGKPVRHHGTK